MRSRINSTGRQKIDSGMAVFAVTPFADGTAEFRAEIDLSTLKLPPQANVVVEAYRQSLHERFSFGTVAEIVPQSSLVLRELEPSSVKFRIKVVEPDTGRVLAWGDRLGADDDIEAGRHELLKVVERDLKQEPWKTEIYDDDHQPALVINNQIPGAVSRFRTDPEFQALILPAALRQVLMMLCLERRGEDTDDEDDGDWTTDWIRFAQELTGHEKPDWSDTAEAMKWIDDVCAAFSVRHGILNLIQPED
ncbi:MULTISPECIES: hypothetical protein [unclassified Bradyrhizobium]|uniref:hypothetical protein n=1 Tax=unclassified Bradyrhizobium TaxID=2631580 RepID=UPI0028EDA34E|nr:MULTISPECIES: hypothetical protein [unclassified Bradyrhizobium]